MKKDNNCNHDNKPTVVDKPFPILFDEPEACCGCSACFAICPVSAISMMPDSEGFLYPIIDKGKCIKCYKCVGVCSFKFDMKKKN